MSQAQAALPATAKTEDVCTDAVFTSPRWKADRRVTRVGRAQWEGKPIHRVDFVDLATCRTGWAELDAFVKNATLKAQA